MGTLDYISPEQIRGEKATRRVTSTRWPAVLYECLTGVVPYPKESEAAVLYAHMADPPPSISEQRPDLPPQLDSVFARAMAKDTRTRHNSAVELLNEVNSAFSRRIRAALSPPGPIEIPEETGIRQAEIHVPTQESARPRDRSAERPTPAPPRLEPKETRAAAHEVTTPPTASTDELQETAPGEDRGAPDETRLGTALDPTRVAGPTRTRVGIAPGKTRDSEQPTGTRIAAAPAEIAAARAEPAPAGAEGAEADTEPAVGSAALKERQAQRRRRLGAGSVAAIAGAVVAVVLAGFMIGRSGGDEEEIPAGTRQVSAGAVDVAVPRNWRPAQGATAIPGLEYDDSVSFTPAGGAGEGILTAGLTQATAPTLLPESFIAELGETPQRTEAVRLGEVEAYRYANLRPNGFNGRLTVYAAPTTGGVATIACSAPKSASGFMPACEEAATSLNLTSGEAVALSSDRDYVDAVDAAVRRLNARTRRAGRRLKAARTSREQAQAAEQLAAAYGKARDAVASAEPSPSLATPAMEIRAALRRAQEAYRDLASAARQRNRAAYAKARTQVNAAVRSLRQALAQLELGGS